MSDTNLNDGMAKLVEFWIVSIQPRGAHVLPGACGRCVMVTGSPTEEEFATNVLLRYLLTPRGQKVPMAVRKYLRVAYSVIARWPKEDSDLCERYIRMAEARNVVLTRIASKIGDGEGDEWEDDEEWEDRGQEGTSDENLTAGLAETVEAQQALIEEQRDRLDRQEEELAAIRDRLAELTDRLDEE